MRQPTPIRRRQAANLISADVYPGRGRQGKPRNVVNQTRQSLSQSALRAALMTPVKDIVAVGNFVLEAVGTSDAATGGALTSSAIPRDGEDGVGFSNRGNVKLFEREALQPTWPRAHRASHCRLRAARRHVTNVKGVELQ